MVFGRTHLYRRLVLTCPTATVGTVVDIAIAPRNRRRQPSHGVREVEGPKSGYITQEWATLVPDPCGRGATSARAVDVLCPFMAHVVVGGELLALDQSNINDGPCRDVFRGLMDAGGFSLTLGETWGERLFYASLVSRTARGRSVATGPPPFRPRPSSLVPTGFRQGASRSASVSTASALS